MHTQVSYRRALLLVVVRLVASATIVLLLTTRPAAAQVGDGNIQLAALRHDTFDNYYRTPFGAVAAGSAVRLRFRTAINDVQAVTLFYYQFDTATASNTPDSPISLPMTFLENRAEAGTTYSFWEGNLVTPTTPAILYYKFRIVDGNTTAYYSDSYADDNDNLNQGGDGAASSSEPFPAFQITVYDPRFQTPAWLQNANVYQIFPDRFRNGDRTNDYGVPGSTSGSPIFYGNQPVIAHNTWNEAIYDPRQAGQYFGSYGNQFFGGDLKGIEDKLDYLQNLGFDTLYLTPIFQARSNHRYDTDNYLQVDPALGGDAALASLSAAISQRGMHLILDGVFNHASSDSLYFDRYHRYVPPDGACESLNSPYRSWFLFNTNSVPCGSNDYSGWFGFDSLPRFNKSDNGYRDFIYRNSTDNVVKHWYDRGASGWRFDVADDGDLRRIWHEFRGFAKNYKVDGPLIGEIWPDASQYLAGDQLDSVMNYRFRKNVLGFARGAFGWIDNDNNGNNSLLPLTPSQFDHALKSVREDYPPPALAAMLNLIDSHDTNRALFVLTEQGDSGLVQAKERLKLAALFQFSYLGAPMVYYGDEAALNSPGKVDNSGILQNDPYNRAPYPWNDEAGDQNVYGPTDANLISFYTSLGTMRKLHPALRLGSVDTLLTGDTTPSTTDDSTYAFARTLGNDKAIIALNNGSVANTADIPVNTYFADGTQLREALTNATYQVSSSKVNVTLAPRSAVILFPLDALASTVQFSVPQFDIIENAGFVTITVTRVGDASGPASVDYSTSDGSATQNGDYTIASGTISFAAGQTSQSFQLLIINDNYQEGTERFNLALSNPIGTTLGSRYMATVAIFDDDLGSATTNPLDQARFFVQQHYYDFLSRYPDSGGWDYWSDQIAGNAANNPPPCANGDIICLNTRRINVSNAFFFELEYQQTGSYVFRLYREAFGNSQPFPNTDHSNLAEATKLPTYEAFVKDRAQVVGGAGLAQSQLNLANAFVQRPEFLAKYSISLSLADFVDALLATIRNDLGVDLSGQRSALIGLGSRGAIVSALADDNQMNPIDNRAFLDAEYNRAFVATQYFGYLRRDPDMGGFLFWLGQVNSGPLRDIGKQHAMVCSFITSAEYQQRFSAVVTHSNAECPH